MPKDRLAEFNAKREELENKENDDILDLNAISMTLPGLFERISPIDEKLKTLRSQVEEVRKIQKNVNVSPFVKPEEIRSMEKTGEIIVSSSIQIRKEIESLWTVDVQTDAKQRLQKLQIDRLSNELRTIMNDFRKNQTEYLNSSKARVSRQMEITGQSPSDVRIDMSYDNPTVFTGGYLMEMQKAKTDLSDVKEREKDLADLEKQIHEMNGLFKEMHMLVTEQGEQLDTIENHVNKAEDHVVKAKKELRQAEEYQSKSRKKQIIIAIIVFVVLIILILIILGATNVI